MSVSVWQQPQNIPVGSVLDFDVVVIGAGIVGAYTAYQLAQRGRKVALLEARFPAAGATGRNAGMMLMGLAENYYRGVQNWGRTNANARWQLTVENRAYTLELYAKFGLESSLERCGSVILGIDQNEAQELEASHQMLQEDGFNTRFSSTDPFDRGFTAALFQPDDCGINPVLLVEALVSAFKATPNCEFFSNAEVFALSSADSSGAVLVQAHNLTIRAAQVTLCTNAFTPLLDGFFADKIAPKRAQMLLTTPLPFTVINTLAYADYGYEYFRQLGDGSFLLGGCRAAFAEQEVGYDESHSANVQEALEQFLTRYFPDVAKSASIVRRWAGIMGFTADSQPLIGHLPHLPQVFYACGFTGHGLALGLVSAQKMLSLMQ
jgi:glycine/D-amino acid oxidase-like deaminating enzyme